MNQNQDQKAADKATLTAIMERFSNWRHPRAVAIVERLQTGEKATKADLEFLDRVAAENHERDLLGRLTHCDRDGARNHVGAVDERHL